LRLFFTFPDRWPGLGLLILRLSFGCAAVAQGLSNFSTGVPSTSGSWLLNLGGVAAGILLIVGFLTPLVSILVAIVMSVLTCCPPHPVQAASLELKLETIKTLFPAVAIALLGPGAYSFDARIFGRREIIIPGASLQKRNDS
jgi:putative oxidoreductase